MTLSAFTVDTTAPAAPTVTSPPSPLRINSDTYTIQGTAEANALVRVYQGGTVVGSLQLTGGATAFSIAVPLAQDAANSFTLTATDAAGNTSGAATVPTITEDSTAPAVPKVTTPSAAVVTNAAAQTIAGTASAGSLVKVWLDSNIDGVVDAGDAAVASQQLAAGATAFSLATPLPQDGTYRFLVTAQDSTTPPNVSQGAFVPTVTKITTPPPQPTITSPASATTTNELTTTIQGVAQADALVEVWTDTNGDGQVDNGETVAGAQQLMGGATNFLINLGLASNTTYNFKGIAVDVAGNISPAAVVPAITQDSSTPPTPTVTGPAGAVSVNSSSYAITGAAAAGTLVKAWQDNNDDGVVDTGDTLVGTQQLAGGATSYSISVPLAANALNSFLVTATNTANGNQSVAANVPDITQDSIAPGTPTIPVLDPLSDTGTSSTDGITANTTPNFSGTAEAGSTVTLYCDGVAVGSDSADDAGSWSITANVLADGTHNVTARATDDAGNTSAASAGITVIIDATAPALAVPSDLVIEATGPAGALVTYPAASASDAVTASPTITYSQASGTAFPLGTTVLTVTATDAAGNASTSTFKILVHDTTAPDSFITSQPPALSHNASAGLSFAGADAVTAAGSLTFQASLDGGAFAFVSSPVSYAGLADGPHSFAVRAIDASGNVDASPATYIWTIDTTPPVISGAPAALQPFSPNGDGVQDVSPLLTYTLSEQAVVTVRIQSGPNLVRTLVADTTQGAGSYGLTWDGRDDGDTIVPDGTYTYTVDAVDAAGNAATEQAGTVVVDTLAPATIIDSGPAAPSISTGASFTFHATEPGSRFAYSLDGSAYSEPTSSGGLVLSNLADGAHTVTVRAIDAAGNTEATPPSYLWTIDT